MPPSLRYYACLRKEAFTAAARGGAALMAR